MFGISSLIRGLSDFYAVQDRRPITITLGTDDQFWSNTARFGTHSLRTQSAPGSDQFAELTSTVSNPSNSFNFPNDFTVECWIYPDVEGQGYVLSAHAAGAQIGDLGGDASEPRTWSLYYQSDASNSSLNFVEFSIRSVPVLTGLIPLGYNANNTWHHVAVCRNQGVVSIFFNGVFVNSVVDTTAIEANCWPNDRAFLSVGGLWADNVVNPAFNPNGFTGLVDEIRISNSARYTSSFVPATGAFSSDSSTVFLWHCDNSLVDDTAVSLGATVLGGTITESGGYRYHKFTSTNVTGLSVSGGTIAVEYILVGGGGAGGGTSSDAGNGGGGGGGGVIIDSTVLNPGNYPVIIGAGGNGALAFASRFGNPSAWSLIGSVTPLAISVTGFRRTPRPAADGLQIWSGNLVTAPFSTYQNLPAYLLNCLAIPEFNQASTAFTTNKPVRVYLIRQATFSGVDLVPWTLIESGKNYLVGRTDILVYYRDYAAGTHSLDAITALYMFEDQTATVDVTSRLASGGGFGGSYSNSAPPGSGGSGGGFAQQSTYNSTATADLGIPGIDGQGNKGGFHERAANRPLSGQGGGGAGTRGGFNTLTPYTARNAANTADLTYIVTGSSAGDGIQWLDGNYYAGGGGGSTHEWYPQGDWSGDTRVGVLQQPGGLGGGGDGRYLVQEMPTLINVPATAGASNTGGGAGGGGPNSTPPNGGSGILIVRYAI